VSRLPRHPVQIIFRSMTCAIPSPSESQPLDLNQSTTTWAAAGSVGASLISHAPQSMPHAAIMLLSTLPSLEQTSHTGTTTPTASLSHALLAALVVAVFVWASRQAER